MRISQVIWDLEDDVRGNVCHIMDHGVNCEEVDEVLSRVDLDDHLISHASGNPLVFGFTSTGKHLAVLFEIVDRPLGIVYPLTAYETDF